MPKDHRKNILSTISSISDLQRPILLEGFVGRSKDFNSTCIIFSPDEYVLIPDNKVLGKTPIVEGRRGIYVSADAEIWRCNKQSVLSVEPKINFRIDEENIPPAEVLLMVGDPEEGTKKDQKKLSAGKSLEGTCKAFERKCAGGGEFINNCAHFLSNAFIEAGYSELTKKQECVNARCDEDKTCNLGSYLNHRIIKAKDLRCWFSSKAKKTADSVKKNSGFWAVYQQRSSDSQGHVAIIDTKSWRYYGTGWFSSWTQEFYQW